MTPPGLTCQELVELVTDYLEGALPEADRRRFEAHIGGCADCRFYLAQMHDTIRVLGMLSEDSISPEAKRELLAAFRTWKQA
jgi:anti-sigma factor RsiW